jgi:hypothetical protein
MAKERDAPEFGACGLCGIANQADLPARRGLEWRASSWSRLRHRLPKPLHKTSLLTLNSFKAERRWVNLLV